MRRSSQPWNTEQTPFGIGSLFLTWSPAVAAHPQMISSWAAFLLITVAQSAYSFCLKTEDQQFVKYFDPQCWQLSDLVKLDQAAFQTLPLLTSAFFCLFFFKKAPSNKFCDFLDQPQLLSVQLCVQNRFLPSGPPHLLLRPIIRLGVPPIWRLLTTLLPKCSYFLWETVCNTVSHRGHIFPHSDLWCEH